MANGTYTYNEIRAQPEVWASALADSEAEVQALAHALRTAEGPVIFTGCGSSYYAAQCAARLYSMYSGNVALAAPASEILLFPGAWLERSSKTTLFAISRSGETSELLKALDVASGFTQGEVLGVTCNADSTLARSFPKTIVARAVSERSVTQTQSFTTMFLLTHMAIFEAAERGDLASSLRRVPELAWEAIQDWERLGRDLTEEGLGKFFFLGSGPNYGLACAMMLAMKEMSLSHTEAYHFLEFRHGPKSMLDEHSLVVGLGCDEARDEELALMAEVRSLGAQTLMFPNDLVQGEEISTLPQWTRGVLCLPAIQFAAHALAIRKGLDPDSPRHLDAVVML